MAKTHDASYLEHVPAEKDVENSSSASDSILNQYTDKEERKIRHRIDWRLIPALGLMYGVSLMDRKNVSNAYIAGMRVDLDLNVPFRYSLITLVFFITYVVFQPPMTVLCRKFGPRIFLPGICLAWGVVIVTFGFGKNWTTLVGLRLLLGLLEAGYFPGCVYLLSTWYTRYEVARRYSIFFLIGSLASAMSGILAFGLMQMEGLAGIRGWQWIFIMEGILTCTFAIIGYTFLVKFPDQEALKPSFKFLSVNECNYVVRRLTVDRGDVDAEPFHIWKFLKPAGDVEIWGFALIFLCTTTVTYGFSFFLPIILRDNLGYSVAASQCLVAPPYVLAAILMYGMSYAGDKFRTRAPILVINSIISVVGLSILGFASNPAARYFGIFIGVAGCNANIPATMAYQANNIRGQWKRALCSATLTGFGGIGGIAGSLVFRAQDRPGYVPGIIACMVCGVVTILTCGLLTMLFRARNKKADRGELVIEGLEGFRYTI